jgi:hypothetical protein
VNKTTLELVGTLPNYGGVDITALNRQFAILSDSYGGEDVAVVPMNAKTVDFDQLMRLPPSSSVALSGSTVYGYCGPKNVVYAMSALSRDSDGPREAVLAAISGFVRRGVCEF